MDDPVTYPYHGAMDGPPTDDIGDAELHRAWAPPETCLAQVGWSQWQHGSNFAGDPLGHRWAAAPSQPIEEQQWAAEVPPSQDDAPGTVGPIWSPLSEAFSSQQQQQQPSPGYRGGSHYDIEDPWASTMPPTPQLTPTWHHAQTVVLEALPAHEAAGNREKSIAASLASTSRKSQKADDHPSETAQMLGWKPLQSAHTNTMATPPRESESDQLEVAMSSSKRPRPDGPAAAAPGPGKKNRVKNRAAAKRCRDKSRQFEIDLSAREKQVTEDHMFLEASAAALREEILTLKNEILQHGDCNCEIIQAYISNVASQVSTASACRQDHRR